MKPAFAVFLCIQALALGLWTGIARGQEYTLPDLYKIALERAERVRFTEENLRLSQDEKKKAVAAVIPDITAFGNYTQYSSSESSGGFVIQSQDTQAYGVRLYQSYSLSGKEFRDISIAGKNVSRTSYDIASFKKDYLFSVATAYYDLLKNAKLVDIARANVDRLAKQRDAANVRLRVGEVTKTAVLRAEAELSGARSDLVKAENTLKFSKANLARIAGLEGDFSVKEPAEMEDGIEDYSLPALKETAFNQRPELKSLAIQKEMAAEKVRSTEGQYWPSVSFQGLYQRNTASPETVFFLDKNVFAGAALNFTIFEGGLRKAQVNEAKTQERQQALLYDDMRRQVSLDVENAYLNYLTQKGIYDALRDELAYASDNFNAVSKQFTYGLATSLDVMDANTLLVTAERQLAEAGYDYHLSILGMKRATGTLPQVR
jgi:outer membrane protein